MQTLEIVDSARGFVYLCQEASALPSCHCELQALLIAAQRTQPSPWHSSTLAAQGRVGGCWGAYQVQPPRNTGAG